jgi:glyoxylase-like metal-dependent hydrolase (beta-lactamase superfamily II)
MILIDPSWNASAYEEHMMNNGLRLTAVLLTHSHRDHTNLATYFADKYQIPVYMSSVEVKEYGFCCENLHVLNDGQVLTIDNISVLCILLPGHTKGSMGYLIKDNFFVGDVIFYEGCGMCTYGERSIHDMYQSIQKIINLCTDSYKIYSGHVYYKMVGQKFGEIKEDNLCMILSQDDFFNHQRVLQEKETVLTEQL